MFESAELGHKIDKATYDTGRAEAARRPARRAVRPGRAKKFPVIILINGVDGAGKGETVNLLNEWMDPRHIQTTPSAALRRGARAAPMWRFWRALPPKGKIGILFGNWYTDPIVQRALGRPRPPSSTRAIAEIVRFERCCATRARCSSSSGSTCRRGPEKAPQGAGERPKDTRWRVTEADWKNFERYDASAPSPSTSCARPAPATRRGSSSRAPTSATAPHRGRILLDALIRKRADQRRASAPVRRRAPPRSCRPSTAQPAQRARPDADR
jgi:hypothetical protein